MKNAAKRIGDLQSVDNKNRRFGSTNKYNFIRVQLEDGKEVPLLFTDKEILNAQIRAQKNPEDLPKVSTFRNLFD